MPSRIRRAYDQRIRGGRLQPDPGQGAALKALERLERDVGRKGLFGGRPQVQGLYLYGPPGRGKSILMDLFFACAPEKRKRRAHFHAFMARIHDLIRQWREGDAKARRAVFGKTRGDDPIAPVASLIASEARLLCFDELQVTDIADAMILGRLFEALFEHRVVLAVTSNRAPEELYKNGINRQLFEPFIDLVRARCELVEVSGERDWRVDRMASSEVWFTGAEGSAAFEALWRDLKGDQPEAPCRIEVLGRQLVIERTVGGVARASFAELCARPLGPQDYLAIAGRFHTLFLEGVPVMDADRHIEARRLVTLVDALYEAGTRLVVLAEGPPEALYPAGVGAFEFSRAISRLNQMTGQAWLERPRPEAGD
jgi:cell division protein ZapE